MQNNIPAHNHTVYSYLQALLTDRHKVSELCIQSTSPFTQQPVLRDTNSHLCNCNDDYRSNIFTIHDGYM